MIIVMTFHLGGLRLSGTSGVLRAEQQTSVHIETG
jgi:hypothetical protein